MKNKKGFTLVEVILSLAVLGIISVAFLTSISSHFSFLTKTKAISQRAFSEQGKIEREIDIAKDTIRDAIKNGTTIDFKQKNVFSVLGSEKVKYLEVEIPDIETPYYTLVSNVRPDILPTIELESIGIKLKQGATIESANGYGTGEFSIVGNFKNDNKYKFDHLLNVVEWYVSTEEYNMPFPKDPKFNLEDDIIYNSYYYPLFPRDYILVSNETINNFGAYERTFPDLNLYAGRHVIFTATPGAKSGKIGKQKVSAPIFISGLPLTESLVVHLDAGFIDQTDIKETEVSGKVTQWMDISSIYGNDVPKQSSTLFNSYEKPELKKTELGVGFIGQFVKFDSNQYLRIQNQNTNNNTIYVFAVIRNRTIVGESVFLQNGSRSLTIPLEIEAIDKDWVMVKESFDSKDNSFIVGGQNVDIAEIIIYNSALTPEKIELVEKYLTSKYKSPIIAGDIEELFDMETTIIKGDIFVLPNSVLAKMGRGYQKYVSVAWSGVYDTNSSGTYLLEGKSLTDPTKTMTYILNVIDN